MSRGGTLAKLSRYLPMDVFNNLVSPASYDAERFAMMNAAVTKAGMQGLVSLRTSQLASVLYLVAFIALTWLSFRKRDL